MNADKKENILGLKVLLRVMGAIIHCGEDGNEVQVVVNPEEMDALLNLPGFGFTPSMIESAIGRMFIGKKEDGEIATIRELTGITISSSGESFFIKSKK